MENTAYLLLGGNLGNRTENLQQAKKLLESSFVRIIKSSLVYQTSAWGVTEQPDFLNQVVEIQTDFAPLDLLNAMQNIENHLGRKREVKFGARTIDLDILYFNLEVIENEQLIVPHPALQDRRFTLVPLSEIAPDFVHPVLQLSNLQLLEKCNDMGKVTLFQ